MSKIKEYFKETKAELKNVIWLSKKQALFYTAMVVVISFLVAYFLGFFDFIFTTGLGRLLDQEECYSVLSCLKSIFSISGIFDFSAL